MKKIQKSKTSVELFDSIQEFSHTIETRKDKGILSGESITGSYGFTDTHSWEEAQDLLQHGYAKGLKDLMECKGGIDLCTPTRCNSRKVDFVGQRPHIVNTIIGKPKTMVRRINVERPTKTVRLFYDCGAHSDVSSSTLTTGGKNAMALVTYLEQNGYRVELNVFNGNVPKPESDTRIIFTVRIKEFKQKLNPLLVSYPLIHPSFFRRHAFRWRETCDYVTRAWRAYGYTLRYYEDDMQDYLRNLGIMGDNDYYIDCESSALCNSIEDIMRIIKFKK